MDKRFLVLLALSVLLTVKAVSAQAPFSPTPVPIPGVNLVLLVNYAIYVAWIVIGIGLARAVYAIIINGTSDRETVQRLEAFIVAFVVLVAAWFVINSIV
ncbi:hypothetical protein B9Q03_13900 [Candidatus Marsarchaeota G2 archaeon OSP_D]|jgi:hypothetical protein|uniref:Uncharacterized protein n=1 Tax=Candidatus Marsarchaeota G2 archaeon OSP_D TaxID=1978157 RepID=A0A2R6A8X9_9ARCH|nr:MAG: hypothetical protein B9Q03_13900 [Candidatus Marsarchaeota G2 archaeon OSP_D]